MSRDCGRKHFPFFFSSVILYVPIVFVQLFFFSPNDGHGMAVNGSVG